VDVNKKNTEELLNEALNLLKLEESDLLSKIEKLYSELKEKQKTLEYKQRKISALEWLLENESENVSKIDKQSTFISRSPKDIKENIADILADADSELHYKHIYDKLISRGIQIPGKDPVQNLLSYLSRDKRFVRIDKGTYTLTDEAMKNYNRIA